MDIKDLNKSQLLLLAILISFVVSIATGITTVTLMEQAPSSVTVPITRVVRQTVEKVVPVEGQTIENTVIIKEEDLVVDAISKNQNTFLIISKEVDGNPEEAIVPAGSGFVISDQGHVVIDRAVISPDTKYFVENPNGKFEAGLIWEDEAGFAILQAKDFSENSFQKANLGDLSTLRTGQKIIVLGGSVSSFIFNGNVDIKIATSEFNQGAMIINLDGEVLGIALMNPANSFASIDEINTALEGLSQ